METLLPALGILLALAALAWVLVGPIFTLMLLARVRRLEQEVGLRQRETAPTEMPRHRQRPTAARTSFRQPRVPSPDEAVSAEPLAEAVPEPGDVIDAVEAVDEPGVTIPPSEETRHPVPVGNAGIRAPLARGEAFSWEELLGGKWLTWVGAIAVVIGVGFFFKYAIDQGLIGQTGRVVIGLLAGMLCFAGGALAMLRNYRFFAQGLVGAALGILYFSLFAAFGWYHLIPQEAAFGGMIVVTASALAFSAYFNAQPTAILGLIGGFLTPIMLSTGQDAQWTLFSYIFILDVGVLGMATFRKWQPLQALAFVLTLVIWVAWFEQHYRPEKLTATLVLMTAFFLLFALLGVWYNVLRRQPAQPADFFLILATPVAYFIGLYTVTQQHYAFLHGLLAVGLAGTYLGLGLFALARNPAGKSVVVSLGGIAAAFLTVAIPLQLTGHWIAIAWAAEGLLLVELGLRFGEVKLRWAGFALLTVVQLILLYYAAATFTEPDHFQTRFTRVDPVVQDVAPVPVTPSIPAAIAPQPAWTELLNGRAFSFLASAIVLGVLAWEYHRRAGVAPATGGVGRPLSREQEWWVAGGLLAAVPLTVLALLLVETFALGHSGRWLFPTFVGLYSVWTALVALAVVALSVTWGPRWLSRVGLGLFGLLAVFLFINLGETLGDWRSEWQLLDPQTLNDSIWYWPLVNPRGLGYLCAIGAAVAGATLLGKSAPFKAAGAAGSAVAATPATVLGVFAYLTALAMVTVEIYAQGVIRDWGTRTSLAVTVAWTFFAVATLVVGIYYRSATVRILALALFGLTTCKVFFYDVWQLETTIRTLAFVVLGISLLLVSYLYRRYRDRIRAWITPVVVAGVLVNGWVLDMAACRADGPQDLVRTLSQRWPVQAPGGKAAEAPGKEQPVVRLALPADLYGVSKSNLGDVRILALDPVRNAFEIPYVLLQPADSSQFVRRPAPVLNLSQLGGNTQFLLDLGDAREPVNELTIEIADADHDYERPVKVYGSDQRDAAEWGLLTKDAYLLDVTRPGHRLTVTKVEFPQSRFHYYKVVIENRGQPPLHVNGAKVYDRRQVRAPRHPYPGEIASQETSLKDKTSTAIIDLRYDRLPTIGLHVDVAFTGNFYRPVTLEAGDGLKDRANWHPVAAGAVYRIDRPGLKASHSDLSYPETPGRYLRLTISNGDDPPLQVKAATAEGIDRYLVAEGLLQPDRPAAVYAGNAGLAAPRYDLARTLGSVSVETLPELKLGPEEANPLYVGPTPPELPWSETHQALLWGGTLAGIAVLGVLTFLLLRQAARASPAREGE